jgi:phosphomannomutase
MSLMVSVSGIRGIIGESLTPPTVMRYIQGFVRATGKKRGSFLIGRDTRKSGPAVERIVEGTIVSLGYDVINIGVAPTPTVLFCTRKLGCLGGIAITASHNGPQWNALKLCNSRGLFFDEESMGRVEQLSAELEDTVSWEKNENIGSITFDRKAHALHIDEVLRFIDTARIRERKFKVAIDPVGGSGTAVDMDFLNRLGCTVVGVHDRPQGTFPRGPEPTPENLEDLCDLVLAQDADIGFAQDPDGDRLSVVSEKGCAVGEEYTLVLAGESYLRHRKTDIVCNLSTSMMVDDLACRFGVDIKRTKIGEINVTKGLLEHGASFGGEGNGGVIVTEVNPCRDSIVGMALILDLLAESGNKVSEITGKIPSYAMKKQKLDLGHLKKERLYERLCIESKNIFNNFELNTLDGIKLYTDREWIHMRLSNTEPVMRIMAESGSAQRTDELLSNGKSIIASLEAGSS